VPGAAFTLLIAIECRKCHVASLMVHLSGPDNEYAAECPICGPVFGTIDFSNKPPGKESRAENATKREGTG
jgi:hypothetical protein